MTFEEFGPFDSVLDVGGNVGEFAEGCRQAWPDARITSFEPIPRIAKVNRDRAAGRWWVDTVGVTSPELAGEQVLHVCTNQPSASTLHRPGALRRERFGIVDRFEEIVVRTMTLDALVATAPGIVAGRCLLKVDVEGHELHVLRGAVETLARVQAVAVEVNQSPDIFVGSPTPRELDVFLRGQGFELAGVLAVQLDPAGDVVQFDGAWTR